MRILVADHKVERRATLERRLVELGYYGVRSVTSFSELVSVTHHNPVAAGRIDLLVVSAELISVAGIKVFDFCVNNACLKHVLIHGACLVRGDTRTLSGRAKHHVRLVEVINDKVLASFLELIEKRFT